MSRSNGQEMVHNKSLLNRDIALLSQASVLCCKTQPDLTFIQDDGIESGVLGGRRALAAPRPISETRWALYIAVSVSLRPR